MKKIICLLILVVVLVAGFAASISAHCTGPHGPINVPKDDKK